MNVFRKKNSSQTRNTSFFSGIYVANCRNGFGVEKFGEGKKTSLYVERYGHLKHHHDGKIYFFCWTWKLQKQTETNIEDTSMQKKMRKHKRMTFEATMVPSCYNCIAVSKCSHLRPKGGLSPLLQKNIVGPHLYPPTKTLFFSTEKTSTKCSSKLGWNQFWGLKIVQLHSWKWFGQTRWISAQKLLEILKITKATAWHEESLPNVCLAQGIQKYLLGCPIKLGLYYTSIMVNKYNWGYNPLILTILSNHLKSWCHGKKMMAYTLGMGAP